MSSQKRTLVTYYSHQGHTRQMAEALAAKLGADCEEIIETGRIVSPFWHALAAGWQAARKRLPTLQPIAKDPATYDLVIVGGPVYGGLLAPAVLVYLRAYGERIRRLALMGTSGGHDYAKALEATAQRYGFKPVAQFGAAGSDLAGADYPQRLTAFCEQLR